VRFLFFFVVGGNPHREKRQDRGIGNLRLSKIELLKHPLRARFTTNFSDR
jgi:hypothetical protein